MTARSGTDGAFTLRLLGAGPFRVEASLAGVARAHADSVAAGAVGVTLVVPAPL